MLRVSLVQKIALPLAALVFLLQFGLGAYALDHERQTLLRQLDARAARLANIREALVLDENPDDAKQIARWLGATLLEQKDVLFCEVKARAGQRLFRGGKLETEPSRRYSFPLPTRVSGASAEVAAEEDPSATEVSSGTLCLVLSTADIERALGEARGAFVMATLAGTGFALLATLLIVRFAIGNTVTRLLKTVKVASVRHFSRPPTLRTGDALEQLGEMLNSLTTELQEVVEKEKRLTAETMAKQGQSEQAVG